jgi:hypothetical protein
VASCYGTISSRILFQSKPTGLIEPNENIEEFRDYVSKQEQRLKDFQDEQKMMENQNEELREQLETEITTAEAEETSIQTERRGLMSSLNPLKPILYPAQQELAKVVHAIRMVKSVVKWDEPYLAWWITTSSFVACIVVVWIPWGFLLRWALRIAVFLILGPWVAIIHYFFIRDKNQSIEEQQKEARGRLKLRVQQIKEAASSSRTHKERAVKLQSMKKYLYGKYLVHVPNFNMEKYPSYPLPRSCASPFVDRKLKMNIVDRKYGQNLTGDMIPSREFQLAANAEEDHKKDSLLSRPWRRRKKGSEAEPLLSSGSVENKGTNYSAVVR